jgi:hypothetical protein
LPSTQITILVAERKTAASSRAWTLPAAVTVSERSVPELLVGAEANSGRGAGSAAA